MKKILAFIFAGTLLVSCDNSVSRKIKEAKDTVSTTTNSVNEISNFKKKTSKSYCKLNL